MVDASEMIRPTVNALSLLFILPVLLLLVVILIPWDDFDVNSPYVKFLGFVLGASSVLFCCKLACSSCSILEDPVLSSQHPQHGLLSNVEEGPPPNYETIMADDQDESLRWVNAIASASLPAPPAPPPYHAVVILPEEEDSHQNKP